MRYQDHSPDWESFLERLNQAATTEFPVPEMAVGGVDASIFGMPRSGTTALYQLLAMTGTVGYPSNLMAMFWRVPWVGARLQVQLASSGPTLSVESVAGRTREPLDPHEFGYFWRAALGHSGNTLDRDRPGWPIDQLRLVLAAVHDVFGAPVTYKNFLAPSHMQELVTGLPSMRFVATRRPLVDVAGSMLHVRRTVGVASGDVFGTVPRGFALPDSGTEFDIVATQLVGLERDLRAVDAQREVLFVDYPQLCSEPRTVVTRVLQFLEIEEAEQQVLRSIPPHLPEGHGLNQLSVQDKQELLEAVERAQEVAS
ncbi:sulfotransferase [Nocardioides sp.]|uniref:sulfotransferase n=1 Tax=Nocardioides sp. TaxID=35761 RepID=UPI0027361317|nr:sulfotransferase [Nocardioides sp.]MDP3889741.1 sulfotransferase [Nocardioides sp.]